MREKILAEMRPIHTEQISLYKFHRVKQDILNQWESMGFPKL